MLRFNISRENLKSYPSVWFRLGKLELLIRTGTTLASPDYPIRRQQGPGTVRTRRRQPTWWVLGTEGDGSVVYLMKGPS